MSKFVKGDLVQVRQEVEGTKLSDFICTVVEIDESPKLEPIYMIALHDPAVYGGLITGVYFWVTESNIEDVRLKEE